jgi:hypothetical protein
MGWSQIYLISRGRVQEFRRASGLHNDRVGSYGRTHLTRLILVFKNKRLRYKEDCPAMRNQANTSPTLLYIVGVRA